MGNLRILCTHWSLIINLTHYTFSTHPPFIPDPHLLIWVEMSTALPVYSPHPAYSGPKSIKWFLLIRNFDKIMPKALIWFVIKNWLKARWGPGIETGSSSMTSSICLLSILLCEIDVITFQITYQFHRCGICQGLWSFYVENVENVDG